MIAVRVSRKYPADMAIARRENTVHMHLVQRAGVNDPNFLFTQEVSIGARTCHHAAVVGNQAANSGRNLLYFSRLNRRHGVFSSVGVASRI